MYLKLVYEYSISSNKPFGSHDLLFDHLLILHKLHRPLPSLNMNISSKTYSINDDVIH